MGLLNFLKKQQNTISDDGLNLIYSKEDGYLLYAFNKSNGNIEGLLQIFYNPKYSGRNPNYQKNRNVGLVYQEYFFSAGKQDGTFKEYYDNGKLKIYREILKSDFLDFENQKRSNLMPTELIVTDSLKINGKLIHYYKNGVLKEEENYINGELVSGKRYYDNGQLKYDIIEFFRKKEGVEYYFNGNIKTKQSQGFLIENVFFDNMLWFNSDGTIMKKEQIIERSKTEIEGVKLRINYRIGYNGPGRAYSESKSFLFINHICFYHLISSSNGTTRHSALFIYNGFHNGVHFINGQNIVSENKLSGVEFYESGIEKGLNSDNEGAIKDFTKAIEIDEKYIDAYRARAMSKWWLREYKSAIDDYTKIIDFNSEDIDAYENRGRAKASLKDYKGALEDFNKTIELDKESKVYSSRGRMKKYLLDYDGALEDYNIAVEKFPEDDSGYFGRGELKYEIEDYLGAIKDFSKCIELKPSRIIGYHKRGDCKLMMEDYNGAIEDYSKVIQYRQRKYDLDSSPSEIGIKSLSKLYLDRGIAKQQIGELNESILDLKKSIELDPNNEDSKRMLKSLNS